MDTFWFVISLAVILVVAAPAYAADECNADADCTDTTKPICTGLTGSKACTSRGPSCTPTCTAPKVCVYKAGGLACEAANACTTDSDCTDRTKPICAGFDGLKACMAEPCNPESCNGHGTCTPDYTYNGNVTAKCTCTSGYSGDKCQTAPAAIGWEYCTGDVCKNGGICSASGITPCICKDGFVGDKCETRASMSNGNNDSLKSKLLLMTKLFNLTMSFP